MFGKPNLTNRELAERGTRRRPLATNDDRLAWAAMTASTPPRTEAEIVIALRQAGCVFAEDEAAILLAEADSLARLDAMVERRVAGEPLEVIVGWAEFCGLHVAIDPGVFVPRRRTEFLVSVALGLAHGGSVIVDLCCGSGALAMAVAKGVRDAQIAAADIAPAAVACARRNLAGLGEVYEGDLFDPLPGELKGTIDLLLVNAPYVPTAEIERMPPEARIHEPRIALDGGGDGLDIHRRVASEASAWLAPGGTLLIETSVDQAELAMAIFERCGLRARVEHSDEYDASVVVGIRPFAE
jgi:release factor glutamine methyltransferase